MNGFGPGENSFWFLSKGSRWFIAVLVIGLAVLSIDSGRPFWFVLTGLFLVIAGAFVLPACAIKPAVCLRREPLEKQRFSISNRCE